MRNDGPQSHLPKAGTPTMGGALILVAMACSTLLWADLRNRFVWILLVTTLGFGAIGFYDDYLKLVVGNSQGSRGALEVPLAVARRSVRRHARCTSSTSRRPRLAVRAVLQDVACR